MAKFGLIFCTVAGSVLISMMIVQEDLHTLMLCMLFSIGSLAVVYGVCGIAQLND